MASKIRVPHAPALLGLATLPPQPTHLRLRPLQHLGARAVLPSTLPTARQYLASPTRCGPLRRVPRRGQRATLSRIRLSRGRGAPRPPSRGLHTPRLAAPWKAWDLNSPQTCRGSIRPTRTGGTSRPRQAEAHVHPTTSFRASHRRPPSPTTFPVSTILRSRRPRLTPTTRSPRFPTPSPPPPHGKKHGARYHHRLARSRWTPATLIASSGSVQLPRPHSAEG